MDACCILMSRIILCGCNDDLALTDGRFYVEISDSSMVCLSVLC